MTQLLKYWPVLLVVLNALTAWGAWSLRQVAKNEISKATGALSERMDGVDGQIDTHDTQLTKLESRMAEVERDIDNLPTKADLARVEGEVKGVLQLVTATKEGVGRLEGFFLQKGVESV